MEETDRESAITNCNLYGLSHHYFCDHLHIVLCQCPFLYVSHDDNAYIWNHITLVVNVDEYLGYCFQERKKN